MTTKPTHRGRVLLPTLLTLAVMTQAQERPDVPQNEYTAAERRAYMATTQHLDPYGNFRLYLNTEGAIAKLDQLVELVTSLLSSRADAPAREQADMQALCKFIDQAYRRCGLRDVDGLGMSSLQVGEGFYRNRFFVHRKPGDDEEDAGLFWRIAGREPHELACVNFLPAQTVAATFVDVDANALWQWHKDLVAACGTPAMKQKHAAVIAELNEEVQLETLLGSADGQFGLLLTLDPAKQVALPADPPLHVPEPGLAIFLKVRDDTIQRYIRQQVAAAMPELQAQNQTIAGVPVRSYTVPLPLPIRLAPTLGTIDGYLVLASTPELMTAIIRARRGQEQGLAAAPQFRELTQGLSLNGNCFSYIGPQVKEELMKIQQHLVQGQVPAESARIFDMLTKQQAGRFFSVGVGAFMEDGLLVQNNSSMNGANAVLIQATVAPTAIMAGMLLPVLSKAREKARRVKCNNNLKLIGTALIMYSGDRRGAFPPDLATLYEGDYLAESKVYGCPSAKKPAAPKNAADMRAGECDYLYFGKGVRYDCPHPTRTVLACDKPGNHPDNEWMNFLFVDGHTEGRRGCTIEEAERRYGFIFNRPGKKTPKPARKPAEGPVQVR